jgi:hypothetical protein
MNTAPENRDVRISFPHKLAGSQGMKDLWPGHTSYPETEGFLGKGPEKLSFPVWVGKFIDDLDTISLKIQRGGNRKKAQGEFNAPLWLPPAPWGGIK